MKRSLLAACAAVLALSLSACTTEAPTAESTPTESTPAASASVPTTSTPPATVAPMTVQEICDLFVGDDVLDPDNYVTRAHDAIEGSDDAAAEALLPAFEMMIFATDGDLGRAIDIYWVMLERTSNGETVGSPREIFSNAMSACIDMYEDGTLGN